MGHTPQVSEHQRAAAAAYAHTRCVLREIRDNGSFADTAVAAPIHGVLGRAIRGEAEREASHA